MFVDTTLRSEQGLIDNLYQMLLNYHDLDNLFDAAAMQEFGV